jgi:hypothetical protein
MVMSLLALSGRPFLLRHSGARCSREPGIQHHALLLDSGSTPPKSAIADLDNDIAELG